MSVYLHRVNTVEEAPVSDVYLLYNILGGISYVKKQDYLHFSHHWCLQNTFIPCTLDLASAECHSVVLDLDFHEGGQATESLFDIILPQIHSSLKMTFLTHVNHFTYIIATRSDGHGVHIHLPEFLISHDDYILLCESLKPILRYSIVNRGTYTLDILQNMTLAGSAKPETKPYTALQIHYVDEKNEYMIDFSKTLDVQLEKIKKSFKRVKYNLESYFRKFLFIEKQQIRQHILNFMMPVATPFPALYRLSYPTLIGCIPNESSDFQAICSFSYKSSSTMGYIFKGKKLLFDGTHFLKSHHYLHFNTFLLNNFETNNAALKSWYERGARLTPNSTNVNPIFHKINQGLRENNDKFVRDSNPIKTIMEYNDGIYFLPMFYALCKCLNTSSVVMVAHLKGTLDKDFFPLLDRMELVDVEHTNVTMKDFTEETIYFCGNNLCDRYVRNKDKLKQIVTDSQRAILSVTTPQQMVELYRRIQESHFPIKVLRMLNSLRKPSTYIWNYLIESWKEISSESEKESHLSNLWQSIVSWLQEYKRCGKLGGPDDETIQKFNLRAVTSTITSDSNLEQKYIQMDRHKWFIRLQDGLLDILTGHIGATVPELFLSDKRLGIDVSRQEMIKLYHNSPDLEKLYELMTDKFFFLKYLKALFTDRTDDLFDTLHEMIQEEMSHIAYDPYAKSMMHFYVHLCKYTAFEHDLLMYLCDVLASIFIATNYERKFFVCKGKTSNGKSKLFEILGRVFGGYYHCIQSDNLKPSNAAGNATPDLASTIFNCRIVTSEELEGKLNENRVKQITGNSCVTFRNMYEASQGGIPTAKLFTSTNNVPDCQATEAFQDRVTAIPFLSRFVNKPPKTTSEQVQLNRYGKDEYAVERSFVGCFLILLYHLKKHMNIKDGLLHYRDEPPSVVEYTQLYLFNADVYNQFKTHMDVQMSDDHITTMTDLRSAVRQFLKNTKNNTTPEADLIVKFEEEFGEYRKSDLQLGSVRHNSILDQEDEPLTFENSILREENKSKRSAAFEDLTNKKRKVESAIVYYDHIIIRNLRRTATES